MRIGPAALMMVIMLVTAGCSAGGDTAAGSSVEGSADAPVDSGYVAGDGSILLVPEAERQPAPDLVGTTLEGGTYRLSDQRGDVVVINVWASWCAPCRAEAPTLAALAEELEPEGVSFVGLDTRDSDVAARSFVERFGITYPNVIDRDGQLQLLFSDSLPPQAIPSTLVIDRQGRVAGRVLGKASESALRGLIEPLQAEASGAQ